jgi:hypothetical protein
MKKPALGGFKMDIYSMKQVYRLFITRSDVDLLYTK